MRPAIHAGQGEGGGGTERMNEQVILLASAIAILMWVIAYWNDKER